MPVPVATIGTVAVILIGLYLVGTADTSDMRFFGWVLIVVGILGLLVQSVLPRSGRRR